MRFSQRDDCITNFLVKEGLYKAVSEDWFGYVFVATSSQVRSKPVHLTSAIKLTITVTQEFSPLSAY